MNQQNEKEKVLLILSGGLDSSTLLFYLQDKGFEVQCLSIDYGQTHVKEVIAAKMISAKAGVPFEIMSIPNLGSYLDGSALTDPSIKVPHGDYREESMKSTIVPNRNMIFLSIAVGYAIGKGIHKVAYAAHSGDHFIYPDCRPEFIERMQNVFKFCHTEPIELIVPFMNLSKIEIVMIGNDLKVPFELTWTCYEGRNLPCGKCGACRERLEAFRENKIEDPLFYGKE